MPLASIWKRRSELQTTLKQVCYQYTNNGGSFCETMNSLSLNATLPSKVLPQLDMEKAVALNPDHERRCSDCAGWLAIVGGEFS